MSLDPLTRRKILFTTPLLIAGAGGVAFSFILKRMQTGSFDPHAIRIPILDKPIPSFSLPAQPPGIGFTNEDLYKNRQPVLINFFASWCIPCITEMPVLIKLKTHIPIWGIAYKDLPENAQSFLEHNGNPYARLASDRNGLSALDWGLSGVPESFLVDRHGIIRWHLASPLTETILASSLMPLIAKLSNDP